MFMEVFDMHYYVYYKMVDNSYQDWNNCIFRQFMSNEI